jgi:predicted outer membrane protein
VGTAWASGDETDPASQPAPLLDENGVPFPPARPKPDDFNAEIAASRFAELAMADALLEIGLGELVKERGESQAVKDLGHRMVTNHGAIRLILAKAAAASEVPLPVSLDAEQQAVLARLSALSGAELDREYLWEQTLRQPRTLQMYQWQYENCDDPRLKPFAMGTLPIIVVHARVCDEVHRKVNADEIRVQDKRAAAERKALQEREQAEAMAAAQKKAARKFKK